MTIGEAIKELENLNPNAQLGIIFEMKYYEIRIFAGDEEDGYYFEVEE